MIVVVLVDLGILTLVPFPVGKSNILGYELIA